jgi:hypothetical protein
LAALHRHDQRLCFEADEFFELVLRETPHQGGSMRVRPCALQKPLNPAYSHS